MISINATKVRINKILAPCQLYGYVGCCVKVRFMFSPEVL